MHFFLTDKRILRRMWSVWRRVLVKYTTLWAGPAVEWFTRWNGHQILQTVASSETQHLEHKRLPESTNICYAGIDTVHRFLDVRQITWELVLNPNFQLVHVRNFVFESSQVKSSQVAFNKKAMTIALHVHNVQTIHNVQRDSKLCKLILTENNWNCQSYNTITRKIK